MKFTYLIGVLVALGATVFVVVNLSRAGDKTNLDAFAQCLRSKGAVMYGADWCPHCQNEKNAFGESFRLVSYVECPADPKRCLEAGVAGYPTWIFSDGTRLIGEQGIRKLSETSGCFIGSP